MFCVVILVLVSGSRKSIVKSVSFKICFCRVGYSKHAIAKPEKEIARTKSLFEKSMKKVKDASKLLGDEIDGMFYTSNIAHACRLFLSHENKIGQVMT